MEKHIHDIFNESILKKATFLFNITLQDVKNIGGFESFIYEYNKAGNDYILRITHSDHRTVRLVEAELDYINYLAKNNANVSVPVHSVNNHLVEVINCEDNSYFTVSSYVKAKGSPVKKDDLNDNFFINYGKTIGLFHRLTKNYKPIGSKRLHWDDELIIKKAKEYLPEYEQDIYQKLKLLIYELNTLPKTRNNYGLIHNDLHMGNFFVKDSELTVFDFDDSAYQWFVNDIAIALFYYIAYTKEKKERTEKAHHFMKLFMKGYLQENKISMDDYKQLPKFIKLREIVQYLFIYRSLDVETNKFAKNYITMYRDRILNDIPFIELDFSKYIR